MVQQERATRTRRSLMRAAAETFSEEGFRPSSLSAISKRAGVSNGALHFHFKNKDLLAQAVEEEAAGTVRQITREADERQDTPLQRLVDATYALMRSIEEDVVVRAGLELVGTTERCDETPDLRLEWQHWIEQVFRAAEAGGGLAEGISVSSASTAVVAATIGFEVLGIKDPSWVSHHMLSQYWDLMLPRLAPPELLSTLHPHGTAAVVPAEVEQGR
ncbi:TetR/AcrR family transcriptional regulator (plasmid) [Streptomyces sp. NBC_01387]|uniref:ScbR family autoregulator-binding transcription factor n=1 Tax=unclassified Streptomyces TaxID=2593676 RepID=UPI0020249277|nr:MULTISPECIES: ScbR family autoregulator-binding transcription factor [unclassified Streptomyces]MCX4554454.1 ScbR family autoregulator-binding transcription factor [Streptomyces sp. NBC_01500]WSC25162.1 TetR/AcrR family transcriptional regulator [Streptomyces sp. NBC_01766]WSV58956.1 TetR/AcrR family transcriptional regulator [Streptomyces sp. NBC_01014]